MSRALLLAALLGACSGKSGEESPPAPRPQAEAPAADARPADPPKPITIASIAEGQGRWFESVAAGPNHVYWIEGDVDGTNSNWLKRAGRDGGAEEEIDRSATFLVVDDEFVYYDGRGPSPDYDRVVMRRRHSGGDAEQLGKGAPLAVADGVVLAVIRASRRLPDAGFTGHSTLVRITPGAGSVELMRSKSIAQGMVHRDRLYLWGDFETGEVISTDLDGKDIRPVDVRGQISNFAVDDTGLYVGVDDRIVRIPHGGGAAEEVARGAWLFAVGSGRVYILEPVGDSAKVSAIDRKTSARTELVRASARSAALGGGRLYLAEQFRLLAVPVP